MATECAEVGVLYNDADVFGVRFHKVPRALFDLIPGQVGAFATAFRPYWTKVMFLADGGGNKLMVTMYCDEPPTSPQPSPTGEGARTLLREIEPECTGEHSRV
jgi:hypothetical protein